MSLYNSFIGMDIDKCNFAVAINVQKETDYKNIFGQSLCILENTGEYELELLYTLCGYKIAVHRADTCIV